MASLLLALTLPALTVTPNALVTDEDKTLSTTLQADVPDARFTVTKQPRRGSVTLNEKTGALQYTPWADFHGSDKMRVEVTAGRQTTKLDLPITIESVNDLPVVEPLKLATREDESTGGALKITDPDRDKPTFSIGTAAAHGEASVDAKGRVTYRPAKDFAGADRFVVVVDDGKGKVEVPFDVPVSSTNDAPLASPARIDGTEDTVASVELVASDVDGDALSFEVKKGPKRGSVVVDAKTGRITFTPDADWSGSTSFSVRITDGRAKVDIDVPVTIAAVNDAPVAEPMKLATDEDRAVTAPLEVRDPDRDRLSFEVKTPATAGTASVDARGRVSYRPDRDKNGTDRFVVVVNDGTVAIDLPVEVTIAPVNDAPVVEKASLSFDEDTSFTSQLLATDVDGDKVRFIAREAPNGGGRFSLSSSGALSWTPPKNYNGKDRFTFEVDDGHDRVAVELPIRVMPVNDAPTLKVKPAGGDEDKPTVTDAIAEDIDGDKLTLRIERQGEKSTATVNNKGIVRITPNKNANGKDTLVVAVDDGTTTVTTSFTVTFAPLPDPPLTGEGKLETDEDTVGEALLPGSDPDGDAVTFKLTSTGNLGTATLLDARTGRISYAPKKDVFGDDVIGFEVTDGVDDRRHRVRGALAVAIRPVDDAPTAQPPALNTNEDTPAGGTLAMSDVDGDALAIVIVAQPSSGRVTIDDAAKGAFTFAPAQDFHGDVTFRVAATETASGKLTSAPVEVAVKVAPVNDPPATRDVTAKTAEDTATTVTVAARDVDGDTLRWTVAQQATAGTATIDATTGVATYTPRKNITGHDAFVVAIADGAGGSVSARVDIDISADDDAPAAVPGDLLAPRIGRVTGKLLGRDPEGDRLTFRIVDMPSVGRLQLLNEHTGEYAYSIQNGTKGARVKFTFVVEAGGKTSAPEAVVIRIE